MLIGKMVFTVSVFFLSAASSTVYSDGWELNSGSPVKGAWKNRQGLSYVFDDNGIMLQIADSDSLSWQKKNKYDLITSGRHNLIKYSSDLSDHSLVRFLMVTDLTDSSATFAHSLAFARADSGSGLRGDWLHVDDLTVINWHIDHETVTYRHEVLDLDSGAYTVLENRTGTYSMGRHMDDTGKLYVDFADGTSTAVFPLLFHDVMYLFDFSEMRSSFFRILPQPDNDVIGEVMR